MYIYNINRSTQCLHIYMILCDTCEIKYLKYINYQNTKKTRLQRPPLAFQTRQTTSSSGTINNHKEKNINR